jgi:hypothetical protein
LALCKKTCANDRSLKKTYAEGRMHFDARVAARLPSGEHMTFEQFPGLRLQASASRKSWTYRYKSPIDARMRQIRLGEWPAMAFPAALAARETHRVERDSGAGQARRGQEAKSVIRYRAASRSPRMHPSFSTRK